MAEYECPFIDKNLRHRPPNAVTAMCCQLHDDLKLTSAMANCGDWNSTKKQLDIIKMRVDYCIKQLPTTGKLSTPPVYKNKTTAV